MNTEQIQRIKDNQKFLLKLLHLHIGNYYPLRRWLGIDYTGKIDEISHLSYGYDTQYFKKGTQWYKKQTRVYQQPDLGYKLNLILERIPEVIIPKVGQPSWGLLQMRLLSNVTITYQPSIADGHIVNDGTDSGTSTHFCVGYSTNYTTIFRIFRGLVKWNLTDLETDTTFIDATVSLNDGGYSAFASGCTITIYRCTQPNWTESATWYTYDGTNSWNNAGGDFTTTNSVSTTCTGRGEAPPTSYWMNFTSAQNLINDCFVNQNRHVALMIRLPNNESGSLAYQWITAREYSYTTLRPKLTIIITGTVSAKNSLSVFTSLRSAGETGLPTSLALSTTLQPNRWAKDTIHTQEWVREPTHDQMYKS